MSKDFHHKNTKTDKMFNGFSYPTSMEVPLITNLEGLVTPYLNGSKITSYETKFLGKPGDNYGSCMIAISAKIQDVCGIEKNLEMVAKSPPLSDFYFKMFCPERTFRTENAVYLDIVPALEAIERKLKVPENKSLVKIFPKCYGGRLNRYNNIGPVDRDALLVQENLLKSGYTDVNRSEFFDLEHCKFILKNLSKFHACSIVLRSHVPEEFKRIKEGFFKRFDIESAADDPEFCKRWGEVNYNIF